jgi:hypothetical protein
MNNKLFSLGDLYVSDFIKDNNPPRGGRELLSLVMDESIGAPKLDSVTNPDKMYGQYWYRSGINATMTNELKSIAEDCVTSIPIDDGDVFLDIACNDGTLLKFVPDDMIKIGIDPVDDSYYNESSQIADTIIQDYFTSEVFKKSKYGNKKAKIITTIAMFYDLDDPISFLRDIDEVLDDNGLFVLQMSYTPLMLKQLAFDNICHEHVYYYSLTSISNLLNQVNMSVVDCTLNDINGGSFRVYIRKNIADDTMFRTAPFRDVAQYRVDSILAMEANEKITSLDPYLEFYDKICKLRDETVAFIKQVKSEGKTVWGYGASTKGNTLLQWYGLDNSLIDGIAERSPYKFGLKTVGTNIPIYSEEYMRKQNPDYMLVLPWHFINEFRRREKDYLNNGGKFIVPCPSFEIIEGE